MSASEGLNWSRPVAMFVVLITLVALGFWVHRLLRKTPQPESPADSILNLVPASYQTITTTVNAADSGGDAAELTWKWRYDTEGRLAEMAGPGGVTTRIAYTASKAELEKVAQAGDRRVFAQDAQGRLLSAQTGGGKVSFSYFTTGMPAEVRSDGAPPLRYIYDVQDRIAEMHVGETAIRYRYDYLGRLAAVGTPAGEITYSYQLSANTVIRRLPNGMQTFWEYDDEGRLAKLTHADRKNLIVAEYVYGYRPDGLIEEIQEKSQKSGERVLRYQYDLMGRLTGVEGQGGGHSYRYRYDSLGNLAESQPTDGGALRFTSAPTGALATDSRGISRTDARGHVRQLPDSAESIDYDFNGAGALAAAKGQSIRYTYNALGLLTARNLGDRQTRYLPDPFADAWQPLWRRDSDGTEGVVVWDGAVPLVELHGKKALYRLEDHLGSIRVEADENGGIAAWHEYTPYGAPDDTGPEGDLSPRFASLFWDPAAKVYLTLARAYDPVTVRFLQPDPQLRMPTESKHSHSLYAYCGGDPLNFVDRNGAEPITLDSWAVWNKAALKSLGPFPTHVLDWGPTERNDVVSEVFNNARRLAQSWAEADRVTFVSGSSFPRRSKLYYERFPEFKTDAIKGVRPSVQEIETRTHHLVNEWRYAADDAVKAGKGPFYRPSVSGERRSYYEDIPNARPVTPHEWQLDENYAYRRAAEVFGKDYGFRGWKQVLGNWTHGRALESGQRIAHFWGERSGKTPESILYGNDEGTRGWLSLSPKFGKYLDQARRDGRELLNRQSSPQGGELPSIDSGIGIGGSSGFWSSPLKTPSPTPSIGQQSKALTNEIMSQIQRIQGIQQKYDIAGGAGRVAGPGGFASPGAHAALADFRSSKPSAPSRVGGVYLGGAGKILAGLGQLKGVAVDDATGKLVLIGSDDRKIALPPLRLEEVVTIFRAVYNYGEPPTVTIDPDKDNPTGPIMHVVHGPGTENTYIGWILFECDRIMKTLQLGRDNITRSAVTSKIPGYTETSEAIFFGDRMYEAAAGSNWERFWIVPSAVRRFDAPASKLSFFELPLKVNTQRMRWEKGKLVDDESGQSSVGAEAFTRWFTDRYDEIADEVILTPPPGSGMNAPVAIFHELRRIALIAAIAERLRDSGESMPFWMRDYAVPFFPVSPTTPSLTVEKKKSEGSVLRIATIYGGVNLGPADKDVHIYSDAKEAKSTTIPRDDSVFIGLAGRVVNSLIPKIPELAHEDKADGNIRAVTTSDGTKLSAVVLPGADTRALAPNRQSVVDMVVPIGLGRSISLTRHYNSFFDPAGEYGKWTLDLPRLVQSQVPVKRDGKQSQYRSVYQLSSSLGSIDTRFDRTQRVEPYGIEMPVATGHPEIAGIASGTSAIVDAQTQQVLFRDGTEWHFDDKNGWLVLIQADGTATRYVRDPIGRVRQMVGYVGKDAVAEIRLEYDQQGRITAAKAKQADYLFNEAPATVSELAYAYGDDGHLATVTRLSVNQGNRLQVEWKYAYEAGRLVRIGGADDHEMSFGYNQHGQLLWEKQGGRKREYAITTTAQGTVLTDGAGEDGAGGETWTYDARMRPVKAELGGGLTVTWQYGKDHEVSETVSQAGKPMLTGAISKDGTKETTALLEGPTYEMRRDESGRPISYWRNGVQAWQASRRPDGTLDALLAGHTEVRLSRHEEGWTQGFLVSAPMDGGKTDQWLKEERDRLGRPRKITDSSGFEYIVNYDNQGRLQSLGRLREGGKLTGASLIYDPRGLVSRIDSSWDTEKREYGDDGVLKKIEVERQGAKSVVTYDAEGRPTKLLGFDGGSTTWFYNSDKADAQTRAVELPSNTRIDYLWSDKSGKTSGEISAGPAVIKIQSDTSGRVVAMTWGERKP